MTVPFVDLTKNQPAEAFWAATRATRSGRFVGGQEVAAFEREWADYCGADHCVMVQSGTQALMFIERWVLGRLKYGDVARVTHWHGIPRRPTRSDAGFTVEDCCQAHGARTDGEPVGKLGGAAAWSFYPTKNLGAWGDAGAVTTDDEALDWFIRDNVDARCDAIQAAVLRAKLPLLDGWNNRRREIAAQYKIGLDTVIFDLPVVPPGADPCWHHYIVGCEKWDDMADALRQVGVEAMIHHGPGVSLPIGPHMSDAHVQVVIDAANEVAGRFSE